MPEMCFSAGAPLAPPPEAAAAALPTLLVVEDDDLDFAVVCDILRPVRCRIERAADLRAAQRRVGACGRPIDLVVTDLRLAEGWPETTFEAVALAWDHKPIIVLSGCSAQVAAIDRSGRRGIWIFDKNDLDSAAFLAAVEAALGRRGGR